MLLNIDKNAKTIKGQKKGYLTGILYLAPSTLSGYNTCPMASQGCSAACLNTAGRGIYSNVQQARINKTRRFFEDRQNFVNELKQDIKILIKQAIKKDLIPCVRLNGTSDLAWESMTDVIQSFPSIQFYDYTKNYAKMKKYLNKELPSNYHLTFSKSELNDIQCLDILSNGGSVAVVFNPLPPQEYLGYQVINGDDSDLRFTDKVNVIVGLKAKGKARKDQSGFTINMGE